MRRLKNIRLPEYDYQTDGYYFITIVTRQRQSLLVGQETIIEKSLDDVVTSVKGVSVDTKIIMSNHVHLILVLNSSALPLGETIRRFKAKVTRTLNHPVWQPNYYEHVIRNEGALNRIREYIIHNPELEIAKFEQFYTQ